jgi:hypothetical protein
MLVPLAPAALSIINAVVRQEGRDNLFGERAGCFTSWTKCKHALDAHLDGAVQPWRIHDIRRSVATKMGDLGVQPHVIEAVLNHQGGHKRGVAGVYNRSPYEREVKAALALRARHGARRRTRRQDRRLARVKTRKPGATLIRRPGRNAGCLGKKEPCDVDDNEQPVHQQEDRPVISDRQRAALAENRIVSSRLRGDETTTDETEVQKEGFRSLNDYWTVQMSEPMETAKFVQLLYSHTLTPGVGRKDTVSLVKLDIDDALRFAFRTRQPWIIRDDELDDLENLYLHPIAAARWLLSLPKRRHLLPPTLRAFLEAEQLDKDAEGANSGIKTPRKRNAYKAARVNRVLAQLGNPSREKVPDKSLFDRVRTELKAQGYTDSVSDSTILRQAGRRK